MRVRVPPSAPDDLKLTLKAAQKFIYRVAGVPVIIRELFAPPPSDALDVIRDAYARNYFRTVSPVDRRRVWRAMFAWPLVFATSMVRYSRLNGRIISERHGRSIPLQLLDQVRLYLGLGILPRWYYIFSLYEDEVRRQARCFLNRYETKLAAFRLLNWPGTTPLNNKLSFAEHCHRHGIPTAGLIASFEAGEVAWAGEPGIPERDLFIKPVAARGGKGAERWDHAGPGQFRHTDGRMLSATGLLDQLRSESRSSPRIVQARLVNHPDIADLSNGALCTARVMSCLDEEGAPEVVAAVFRMAIGGNVTVDNIHAGGIAAEIALDSGILGPASDLGDDARLGWLDRHPDSGGAIKGRRLPLWEEVKALAVQAHGAFTDRTVIGWDIAITTDGPTVIEGNSGPDVDLLQRPMRRGLGCGRLGDLMAFHLERRGHGPLGSKWRKEN